MNDAVILILSAVQQSIPVLFEKPYSAVVGADLSPDSGTTRRVHPDPATVRA